jgi:hypothetical protein
MPALIVERDESGFTIQVTVPYMPSMLDFEEALQQQLNDAGILATQEGLKQFDTDGSPITIGATKLTSPCLG